MFVLNVKKKNYVCIVLTYKLFNIHVDNPFLGFQTTGNQNQSVEIKREKYAVQDFFFSFFFPLKLI